ncbi:MAG: hypothetical protein WDN69_09805 [Aliidongia sp.]
MVCPAGLARSLRRPAAASSTATLPPSAKAALAEFMASGSFGAHIRRMRALYQARQEALLHHARHRLDGAVALSPSGAGLHLVGRLADGRDDRALAARIQGAAPAPLSRYFAGPVTESGLILGYAGWDEPALAAGVQAVARGARQRVAP